ncbi:MAG TPA: ATP-binding protein [Streptosporangiaceae bacterium]|nr:ATP-binding protein [Streptosporangiaceae bacterium]
MYDTARAALQALTDDELFERVAVKVLRTRFPDLRITGPSGDLNRDAFGRPLFGEHDKIVLLVSCEARWTVKLKRDLSEYAPYPAGARPARAIFVTNRSTKQTTQKDYKKWSRDEFGIELEVVDLNELAVELESDALYRVAEFDLGVRPRAPRVLQPVAVFRERQEPLLPGAAAPLVGRDREIRALRDALARAHGSGSVRVAVVEGPAGVGKTRLAIDAAHATATTLVAAPGTAVRADSLADVPLDAPSIVVADDARDLGAVEAAEPLQVQRGSPGIVLGDPFE